MFGENLVQIELWSKLNLQFISLKFQLHDYCEDPKLQCKERLWSTLDHNTGRRLGKQSHRGTTYYKNTSCSSPKDHRCNGQFHRPKVKYWRLRLLQILVLLGFLYTAVKPHLPDSNSKNQQILAAGITGTYKKLCLHVAAHQAVGCGCLSWDAADCVQAQTSVSNHR